MNSLIILTVCSYFMVAEAWGRDGHNIVGNIANITLSDKARAFSSDVLNGETLSGVANWADEIASDIPWSYSLHFINVQQTPCENDGTCTFSYERDCVDDVCVAGAILNYTSSLSASTASSDSAAAVVADESLRFLTHFMGDIHQPLHAARAGDKGGNTIDVTFYVPEQGSEWDLHQVWDFGLISRSINETFHGDQNAFTLDLIKQLNTIYADEAQGWVACLTASAGETSTKVKADSLKTCVSMWAEESLTLALSDAYLNELGEEIKDGDVLTDEYYVQRLPPAQKRVLMAGVRLAAVIEYAYDMA